MTDKGLLAWAIKAQLPLIYVRTTDKINFAAVLRYLAGKEPIRLQELYEIKNKMLELRKNPEPGMVVYGSGSMLGMVATRKLYETMVEAEATLVIYDLEEPSAAFFDAGQMPVPQELVVGFLRQVLTKDEARALLPALGGLTLKEISEVYRLTAVRDGIVTFKGLGVTRKSLFTPRKGVSLVDTTLAMYWPQAELKEYAGWENQHYFLKDAVDHRLRPRGLMLVGAPGVGKTAFAKYLANEWSVPLFRLSVEIHDKFVGQSEENMAQALAQVVESAPCILLWDEVEKMFSNSPQDSGTTKKVLAQALWWLQEHQSRVLSIMTSNSLADVPPELYRPGRLDKTQALLGLIQPTAVKFACALIDTFDFDAEKLDPYTPVKEAVERLFGELAKGREVVPHGVIEEVVVQQMKKVLLPKSSIL